MFVLAVHVLFGIGYEAPEGEGGLNFVLNLLQLLVSTGIAGFFLVMIILTWINRFVNFSTSGGLYTVSLLIISITPGIFFLEEVLTNSFFSPYIGLEDSGFLPEWSSVYYLIFGGVYAGVMFILTVMYQRAFTYVITDKQVYLKKDFLKVIDSNSHAISLSKIENLKVERSLIGRILGYGSPVSYTHLTLPTTPYV